MDNEKLNNEETVEEVVEETVETEEAVEETVAEETVEEESVEETVEEIVDEPAEISEAVEEIAEEEAVNIVQIWQCPKCETICDDSVCTVCGEQCELIEIEATAGEIDDAPRKNIGAIIGGAVAAVIVLVAALWYFGVINPYEIGYVDVSGVTLEDLADQSGYSLKEFKKINGLSWLMPKSTNENAVSNNIKVKTMIKNNRNMNFEDLKEYFEWGDNITENSTMGKARGETKLSIMLGIKGMEEDVANQTFAAFKKDYGFGDDVTLDTLYKDVRVEMDKKRRETRLEQEKEAEKEAEKAEDDATVETKDAEEEPEEAPAEEKEAE